MVSISARPKWGANKPRYINRIDMPTPRLWVHHTGGEERGPDGVRSIQRYHMHGRGWSDIAYSFLVDDDGTIYTGRGAGVAGGHTRGDNTDSHAICLMGNFQLRRPSKAAVRSTVVLAVHGQRQGWWVPTLRGHRDAPGASTACPGKRMPLADIRRQVAAANIRQQGDSMASDEQLERVFRKVLDEGTGRGATDWAGTNRSHHEHQVETVRKIRDIPSDAELGMIFQHLLRKSFEPDGHAHDTMQNLVREAVNDR